MELKVSIVTGDFEAAAGFLKKIGELISDHGEVIRMNASTEEIEVRPPHLTIDMTAEASSEELAEDAPADEPGAFEEMG